MGLSLLLRLLFRLFFHLPADNNLINQAVFHGLLAGEKAVSVCILFDAREALPGVFAHDVIDLLADTKKLLRMDMDIACLPLYSSNQDGLTLVVIALRLEDNIPAVASPMPRLNRTT